MNQTKILDEALTTSSKRFLEKNGLGVEVFTRTYLGILARANFSNQLSERSICAASTFDRLTSRLLEDQAYCKLQIASESGYFP